MELAKGLAYRIVSNLTLVDFNFKNSEKSQKIGSSALRHPPAPYTKPKCQNNHT